MPWPSDYLEHTESSAPLSALEAEWRFTASSDGVHVVLPDGRMDLIVAFRGEDDRPVEDLQLMIVGPAQRWSDVTVMRGDRFFGVRFRPGRGGACLGVEAALLRDAGIVGREVHNVLGSDAEALRSATTPAELAVALRGVARCRAASADELPPPVKRAIELVGAGGGRLSLGEVAAAVDIPQRSLRRHLSQALGLTFKAYSSVLRFQRTMRLLTRDSHPLSLAEAALEGGYSDQAHMTREFRRHGGFTPGARPPLVLIGMAFD
ncbi:helix-turn-helix domain-containing protein [Luteibacter rhizovicinus]